MNLAKAQQQKETLQEIIDKLEVTLYRVLVAETNLVYNGKIEEVKQPLDSDVCFSLEDEDFTNVWIPELDMGHYYYYFKDKKIAQGYAEGLYEIKDGEISMFEFPKKEAK